ncbi:HK97 gp10 family phage protein [Bacillus sp. 1P06AnD]|uniref:HK97 gp10 family phage protein n=1 Tax=Bacillus sp. 1P06AnD TaxID=3132208 RepID=UPI0039A20E4A
MVNNFANQLARTLQTYTKGVEKKVKQVENKVSNETVVELKQNSPKDTGSYAAGWGKTKVDGKTVIRNKTDPQLTHLLEHGHAKAGGGRVAAHPHIRPAEERAVQKFTEGVERAIRS